MNDKEKNKRAIIVLAVFTTLFLGYQLGFSHFREHWDDVESQLIQAKAQKAQIEKIKEPTAIELNRNKQLPAFEMPKKQDEQRIIFRNAIRTQIKKAGMKITAEPKYTSTTTNKDLKLKMLKLQCTAQGSIQQVFELLAKVEDNPQLIAFENFKIARDAKKRNKINATFTATTFSKIR